MGRAELKSYFEQATTEMQLEYERIRLRAAEDPGTAGDEGEENWAQLLRRWLPGDLAIATKGRVLCATGEATDQVDIVVCSPTYPLGMRSKKMHLASEVLAIFECKTTLKAEHIRETVKRAARAKSMIYRAHGTEVVYGLVAHSHSWKSSKTAVTDRVSRELAKADAEHVRHPNDRLDFVCISNFGMWASRLSIESDTWGSGFVTYYSAPDFSEKPLPWPEATGDASPIGRMISRTVRQLSAREDRYRGLSNYYLMSQLETGWSGYKSRDVRHWLSVEDRSRGILVLPA